MRKKTQGETLRCSSFTLHIVQHNCSTYLLHHHKPSTVEENVSPFACRCAMSLKPSVRGTETSGHRRWMPSKPQHKIRYVFPTRLIKHHNMFLEGERHLITCWTRFLCPSCRLAVGFKMLPVGHAQQDGFHPCQPRAFWKAVWGKAKWPVGWDTGSNSAQEGNYCKAALV